MTLFYRAVLRDPGDRLGPRLRRCFAAWAPVDDDGSARLERSKGRTRVTLADTEVCGRYVRDVPTGPGRMRTVATWALGRRPEENWVSFAVEGDLSPGAEPVRAPEVVARFLDTTRAGDGAVPLEAAPHVFDQSEVDRLCGWLAHPDRSVPVIVMTVDRADPEVVDGHARHLAEALTGIAIVVRLYDVQTQDRFNRRLGEELTVFGGGLRTYFPGLHPGGETFAPRHPVRGGGAIRDQGARALGVVIDGVMDYAARRPLPPDVRRADARVGRILAGQAAPSDLHAAPPTPARIAVSRARPAVPAEPAPARTEAEPAAADAVESVADRLADRVAEAVSEKLDDGLMEALVAMARGSDPETARLVRTSSAHLAALTRLLEQAGPRSGRAARGDQREAERLRKEYDQLEFDYELLLEEERRAQERIRWLESRLAEHADPVYGLDSPVEVWEAASLTEVVMRARQSLPRVELAEGVDAEAAKLDVTYPRKCARWTGKAWDALRALDAYATARAEERFSGGFHDWCSRPLPGRPSITPSMVSMKESESVSVNPRMRRARTFRVPTEVDPTGQVYMPSHIKLQRVGSPAPRMHFLDDAGGATGRIWIGYLGDHLPNTRTN
ncbi:hypothetical protein [Glycomyces salinus]|uniref:hypothetical protein n=1 Tax=Glycomyces salinus TaxID=980294 RepID=UPI0018ED58AA|nr:hypothetical protein [Glycomyces salinus]